MHPDELIEHCIRVAEMAIANAEEMAARTEQTAGPKREEEPPYWMKARNAARQLRAGEVITLPPREGEEISVI